MSNSLTGRFVIAAILMCATVGEAKSQEQHTREFPPGLTKARPFSSAVNFGEVALRANEKLIANCYFRTDLNFSTILPITLHCERFTNHRMSGRVLLIHGFAGGSAALHVLKTAGQTPDQVLDQFIKAFENDHRDLQRTHTDTAANGPDDKQWRFMQYSREGHLMQLFSRAEYGRTYVFQIETESMDELVALTAIYWTFCFESSEVKPPSLFTFARKQREADGWTPDGFSVGAYRDGTQQGLQIDCTASGRPIHRKCNYYGVVHGELASYWPDGRLNRTMWFADGKRVGMSRTFRNDGSLASILQFSNDKPHGVHCIFFRNGNPLIETTMVEGLAQGKRNHYISNGQVFAVSTWRDDQQVSSRIIFTPTAQQVNEIEREGNDIAAFRRAWQECAK